MKKIIKIMLLLSVTGLCAADMADQAMDDTSTAMDMPVDNQDQNATASQEDMPADDQSAQDQGTSNQAMSDQTMDTAQDNTVVADQDITPIEVVEKPTVKTEIDTLVKSLPNTYSGSWKTIGDKYCDLIELRTEEVRRARPDGYDTGIRWEGTSEQEENQMNEWREEAREKGEAEMTLEEQLERAEKYTNLLKEEKRKTPSINTVPIANGTITGRYRGGIMKQGADEEEKARLFKLLQEAAANMDCRKSIYKPVRKSIKNTSLPIATAPETSE